MFHWRLIRRQITRSPHQTAVLMSAVALSIITFVALRGFGRSINDVVLRDARQLLAADIQVRSNYQLSDAMSSKLAQLRGAGTVATANSYELLSMARKAGPSGFADDSLPVELKVVDSGYPFYGEVKLQSGASLNEMLRPGIAVVEQSLLERLEVEIGTRLRIGDATLVIGDVMTQEPDRPVDFFRLGPRVLLSSADLDQLGLVGPSSRVSYRVLIKVKDVTAVDQVAQELMSVQADGDEGVVTFENAESGLQRFYENFLFYLAMVGIFTLVLSGIGMQVALTAFLREQRTAVAIIKTVGATSRFVFTQYFASILILGTLGSALGILGGLGLQSAIPEMLGDLLPDDFRMVYSGRTVSESIVLGLSVAIIFTFLPLFRLEELRPSFIFRQEITPAGRRWPVYSVWLAVVILFTGAILLQLGDWGMGLAFAGGMILLLLVTAGVTEGVLRLIRRNHSGRLDVRQALRSLFRPGNSTRPIVVALAASSAVLFCMILIEQSLDASLIRSFPPDAPNFFVIDIQPDQLGDVKATLDPNATYYPVVRATVAAINGAPLQTEDRRRDGRNWQFGLTYRHSLLEGEKLAQGKSLFTEQASGAQVSVLDDVRDVVPVKLGDRITFQIQGVPLDATVTSIRRLDSDMTGPFFAFVLPPSDLEAAPHTLFAGTRVPEEQIPMLQNQLVKLYPNLTAVDITATVKMLVEVATRLSQLIRLFASVSLLAGVLIVISSIYATRLARIQEAAYYKVLGASKRFVVQVFTLENLLIGGLGAGIGVVLAQVGSWAINRFVLELPYRPFWGTTALLFALTTIGVAATGVLASLSIIGSKPIQYLRKQNET